MKRSAREGWLATVERLVAVYPIDPLLPSYTIDTANVRNDCVEEKRVSTKLDECTEQAVVENAQKLAELEMLVGTQISNVDAAGK